MTADPAVVEALRGVSAAAGIDLSDLAPPQRALVANIARLCIHQSLDLIDNPTRPPRWQFTDPSIVEGWGRGSGMVPGMLAQTPELADVTSFLDVGTGGGWLALAAAEVWPKANIVGIDVFGPSLTAARSNVDDAGLADRITILDQDVTQLDDNALYDCAWLPTFFLNQAAFDAAVPRLFQALSPGGWLVLGRFSPPPDPLAQATIALRCVWAGGTAFSTEQLTAALDAVGCASVHPLLTPGPAPIQYVIGQRPV